MLSTVRPGEANSTDLTEKQAGRPSDVYNLEYKLSTASASKFKPLAPSHEICSVTNATRVT
jgi:hypothetical protein